jgi:hypothetical protein
MDFAGAMKIWYLVSIILFQQLSNKMVNSNLELSLLQKLPGIFSATEKAECGTLRVLYF